MGMNGSVAGIGLLAGGLFISYLTGCAAKLEAQAQTSPGANVHESAASILDAPVKDFKVEHANMAEALLKLRNSDDYHHSIAFERVPHPEGEKGGTMTLAVTDGTLGGVVQRLCQADSRYEYAVVNGLMIDVRPKGAAQDPKDLLNTKINYYNIDANVDAAQAIERIAEDAPELSEFLYRKGEEWAKRTGESTGSAGSILSGNMLPPRFTLELRNVTVRQILDDISLKSLEMFKEGKNYGPVGWEYDFVIHPNAPTGLGGYPRWSRF